jgi:hypothetical protein
LVLQSLSEDERKHRKAATSMVAVVMIQIHSERKKESKDVYTHLWSQKLGEVPETCGSYDNGKGILMGGEAVIGPSVMFQYPSFWLLGVVETVYSGLNGPAALSRYLNRTVSNYSYTPS